MYTYMYEEGGSWIPAVMELCWPDWVRKRPGWQQIGAGVLYSLWEPCKLSPLRWTDFLVYLVH